MTRNRSWSFLIIVLLLGVTAFSGTEAAASGADVQRPLKVSLDFVAVDPDPAFGDCGGLPLVFPAGSEGTGNLSHLGRVEILGNACNDFVNLKITDGFAIYTAANGDYIEVEYSGEADLIPDGFVGEGLAEIVGGTGRFEASSGEFEFEFTTIDERTLLDGDGWITYDASNRRNK